MRALVALAVRLRDPQREEAQYAARLLEARQPLPLSLEHGEKRRMKRVRCLQCFTCVLDREPARELLLIRLQPRFVLFDGRKSVFGKALPLEEAASDDLRGLGRHDDGLAEAIEQLLEALEVRLVLGRHLELGRRDGDGQDHVVAAPSNLREVVQERVELSREPALAAAAHVVHQLVEEDERRLPLGQHALDDVAARRDQLLLVLLNQLESFLPAELERDLTPRRLAERRAIAAAATADGVELSANEDGRCSLRHTRHACVLKNASDTLPRLRLVAVQREVEQERERVGLTAAKLLGEVKDGRGLDLHAGEAPNNLRRELAEVLREEGAFEELGRVLVHGRRAPISNVVEVDRELRRVERLAIAQVLARGDDLVPGLHCHVPLTFTAARSARNA